MGTETNFVSGAGGAIKLSQSYNFVDKREAIDELRTLIDTMPLCAKTRTVIL